MIEIRTFGGLTITRDGAAVTGLASRKAMAMLVYLAYTQTAHAREVLAELFWEEQGQEQALGNLRVALASLKGQVGAHLEITRQTLAWNAASQTYCDALALVHHAGVLAAARKAGRPLLADEQRDLDAALNAYAGDFLHGFYLKDSAGFEEWALLERERLRTLATETLCSLADDALVRGDYRTAAGRAGQLLRIDPTKEECHRKAMLALALLGNRSAALAQFERCRRALAEQLDVEPEPETVALYHRIREGLVSEAGAASRPDPRTAAPDASNTAPPLPTPLKEASDGLARPVTCLIGREHEVAGLTKLITQNQAPGAVRAVGLMTLVGAGGSGKTRLALEVAAAAGGFFADGVTLLDVAAVAEPWMLDAALAGALMITEQPDRPLADVLLAALAPRRQLIVLDGCEHLAQAAGALALAIVRAAPQVRVLVTSQVALGVPGEMLWHVKPLPFPETDAPPGQPVSAERVAASPAIQLFVERAQAVSRDFRLTDANAAAVAHICRRLDGLPLALELAAARVKLLSPQQIADRLDGIFRLLPPAGPESRHNSLAAAMAWSCSLLSNEERTLLGRLAVFRGGFTLEAAEAICADDALSAVQILHLLGLLVDKSFLSARQVEARDASRYHLLEVVRQYTVEWLSDAGEAGLVHARHLAYYRELAEGLDSRLRGPAQNEVAQQIEFDYDNYRQALAWGLACSGACVEDALRLVAALADFWQRMDRFDEARTWLDRALSVVARAPAALQASIYSAAGTLSWLEGNYAEASLRHGLSLERWREVGNRAGAALALNDLATVACYEDHLSQAQAQFAEALEIYEELNDERGVASVLIGLNFLAALREDYPASRAYGERSLPLWRKLGDDYRLALVLHNLGDVARLQGDFDRARLFLEESIGLCRRQNNRRLIMMSLTALGRMALGQGKTADAASCLRQGLELSRKLGDQRWLAELVEGLAELAVAERSFARGARLFGGAMTLLSTIRGTMWQPDQREHQNAVESAKAALGFEQFEAEWVAGSVMSTDRLLDYALADG